MVKEKVLIVDDSPVLLEGSAIILEEATRRTKVILNSDVPPERLRRVARNCGTDGYIQKTINEADLISQVRTWSRASR